MTTLTVSDCIRLRAFNEGQDFGVEGSIGSFFDVPFVEGSVKLTLNQPRETPALGAQHIDYMPKKVRMPKSARLDFQMNLAALAARADSGVAAVPHALAKLLEIFMGGMFTGTGSQVNGSGATARVITVDDASDFSPGCAAGFVDPATGLFAAREILSISTNEITLKHDLPFTPADNSAVYASVTCYLDNTPKSNTTDTLQVAYEGLNEDDDRYLLKGGQLAGPISLEMAPGTIPRISFSCQFADWDIADGINTTMTLTGVALADQSYASTGINTVMDSELRIFQHTVTGLSNTLFNPPTIKVSPMFTYLMAKSPGGVNTVLGYVRARVAPAATAELAVVDSTERAALFSRREAETALNFAYQIGSTALDGCFLCALPKVRVDDWQPENVGGIAGTRVPFYAQLDDQVTPNTDNLAKSAMRLHFF